MIWSDKTKVAKLLFSLISVNDEQEYKTEILAELRDSNSHDEATTVLNSLHDSSYDFEVALPAVSKPEIFIATVCKDTSQTPTCKNRKSRDINDILKDFSDPKSDFISADNLYFYQPIIVARDGISFTNKMIASDKELAEFLASANFSLKDLPKAKTNALKKLKSLNFMAQDGKLILELPVFDPVKCGQEMPNPK